MGGRMKGDQVMANKSLFKSMVGKLLAKADTVNEAGGVAYAFEPRHALAQYAVTGCLNSTFYASADQQLDQVLALCAKVDADFIARTALFARERGYMKDMPAVLTAVLSVRSPGLMAEVFDRVIDSPKMLRNFVQVMRSGVVGRKSLGSMPKRMVQQWLEQRSDDALFRGSVGNDPSLADVIKMVHPRPKTASRGALYAYLIGREHDSAALPPLVQQFEAYKAAKDPRNRREMEQPDVPFQMLTALDLSEWEWKAIARHAPWQMTRMNLNTFCRHGVFKDDAAMVNLVAERLRDREMIAKARAFPYQLMVAYLSAQSEMPREITEALQDAMETAIENVPRVQGKVYVFPDVSGSMQSPVTGHRAGSTTAVRCIDVAALVAAAVLRKNPDAKVVPFSDDVVPVNLNPRDSVMTNAKTLASLPSGGTNCSAPLAHLNQQKAEGDLVVYVSDNQSWIETACHGARHGSTATMTQWELFKRRNPKAKMVCIDIQPYGSTQAKESSDVTNVGGFSDQVFELMASVAEGKTSDGYWVKQIESVVI